MIGIIIRVIAGIAIVAGLVMKFQGYPEGDAILKIGIAIFVLLFLLGLFKVSKHSRGTPM